MCGITGLVGDFIPGLIAKMNASQAHRGPDGEGIFEDPEANASLGHVRLAILDLSPAAAQPMHSADGRFVLSYNGEIYNYLRLKQELIHHGHNFTSSGDTEVLLHGLIEYQIDFITKLNGIFAFALWDRRERELLLARDPLGVKPLYYTEPRPGTLLFASEMKTLCAHPDLQRQPDFDALQQHLAYSHASGRRTALKGVYRLAPGHWLSWRASTGRLEIQRFWQPPFADGDGAGREDALIELRNLIRKATARQLVSDVPVGSFLSGGLDSSYITTLASQKVGEDFQCYTITYPSTENILDRVEEDIPYARGLARRLGLALHEIELKPKIAELWPRLIHHLDEPIADPAAIGCFLICKLASEGGTKVLLSGQGGDELFCGYPRYLAMHATEWLNEVPAIFRSYVSSAARHLPGSVEGGTGAFIRRIRRVLSGLEQPPGNRFLGYCANTPQDAISQVLSPEFKAALNGRTFSEDCLQHMERENLAGIQRLQQRDLSIYLPNHNLLYTDKMGMAVGLEARVPLLDLELVNRVVRYPYEWQLARGKTKVLFREAARDVVPREIIDRPKAGFGAPYRKWLRYDLDEMWRELTSENAVRKRGWFDYEALQDARARSQAGKDDLYMLQWAVLTMELWARQFVDRNPTKKSSFF